MEKEILDFLVEGHKIEFQLLDKIEKIRVSLIHIKTGTRLRCDIRIGEFCDAMKSTFMKQLKEQMEKITSGQGIITMSQMPKKSNIINRRPPSM